MAELIQDFPNLVSDRDGKPYIARVYGDQRPDGKWVGWLAFIAAESKHLIETGRETEQASKQDLASWAKGLEPVYLDGALQRAKRDSMKRAAG